MNSRTFQASLLLCTLLFLGCSGKSPVTPTTLDWESTRFLFQLSLVAADKPGAEVGPAIVLQQSTAEDVEATLKASSPPPKEVEREPGYVEADFGTYRWVFWLDSDRKVKALGIIVRVTQDSEVPKKVEQQLLSRYGQPVRLPFSFDLDGEKIETDLEQSTWNTPHGSLLFRVPYDAERQFSYLVLELAP